jgi:hypothetical protein
MGKIENLIKESGLDKVKSDVLIAQFNNFYEIAAEWKQKADTIIVTDVSHKEGMSQAREGRLFLKDKRVQVEKTRKQLKEASLREGQAIDKIAKELTSLIVPIEESLEQKEKFIEIREKERIFNLNEIRNGEMVIFRDKIQFSTSLGEMSEEEYKVYYDGIKNLYWSKVKEEEELREAEEQRRLEAEQERQRILEENKKLKLQNEEKEKELDALKKNDLFSSNTPIVSPDSRPLEDNTIKDDKAKLVALSNFLLTMQMPELNNSGMIQIVNNTKELLRKTSNYIIDSVNKF